MNSLTLQEGGSLTLQEGGSLIIKQQGINPIITGIGIAAIFILLILGYARYKRKKWRNKNSVTTV